MSTTQGEPGLSDALSDADIDTIFNKNWLHEEGKYDRRGIVDAAIAADRRLTAEQGGAEPDKWAPLPWSYRQMRPHFAIEADNGVRVAEVRYVERPDGTTSEEVARFIVSRVNATPIAGESSQPIAADSYYNIAETIGTLDGYSVQEHVEIMRETLQACSDFLHDFDESQPEAVHLAASVRNCLSGHIDLVDNDDGAALTTQPQAEPDIRRTFSPYCDDDYRQSLATTTAPTEPT